MADIIDFTTARIPFAAAPVPATLSTEALASLMQAALGQLTAPCAGALILLWDANGIAAVSDNRANMYTQEQLMWLAYGAAHLKGRGVQSPQVSSGQILPPEGA